jgi:hypothetical protein
MELLESMVLLEQPVFKVLPVLTVLLGLLELMVLLVLPGWR